MRVLIRQFLGQNHSWSVCGWGIAKSLIKMGHQVDLFATDGIQNLPESLKPNLIGYWELDRPDKLYGKLPQGPYDCQISYTSMKNFPGYLNSGSKNRFGIWLFEWDGKNALPNGFAKHYKSSDRILAPSSFGKQVFVNSGIPENHIEVVPHGVEDSFFEGTDTIDLKTDKKFKILVNIAQNHSRKNIPGLLKAYGEAFNKQDDVCLIFKGKHKPARSPFEVSLDDCMRNFKKEYPNHAEIKMLSEFLPDISALYRSVDVVYNLAHCEGFYFPALEGLASGKMSITPNYGGPLDFLDNDNSMLVDGRIVKAPYNSMYWESKANTVWFEPSISDAAEKLRLAKDSFQTYNAKIEAKRSDLQQKYSWDAVVKQINSLCI